MNTNFLNHIKQYYSFPMLVLIALVLSFSACEDELPEAGSLPDLTPPEAAFSYSADDTDHRSISFSNLSISATDYLWDLGNGTTSTETNPSATYDTDGAYDVTLTASDRLGATSTVTKTIDVVEPVVAFTPEIMNPGFDIEGDDAYRDFWRNGDLGGVIQITGSPIHAGVKAAKLPSAGDRIGYQLIAVEADTDYTLRFFYTMKTSPVGTMTVSILNGEVTDPGLIAASTIASVTLDDQNDANTYVSAALPFNSGASTTVAIYFTNVDVECRIDSFTIE